MSDEEFYYASPEDRKRMAAFCREMAQTESIGMPMTEPVDCPTCGAENIGAPIVAVFGDQDFYWEKEAQRVLTQGQILWGIYEMDWKCKVCGDEGEHMTSYLMNFWADLQTTWKS